MSFNKDFIWGASTASYQIEGAWNKDGKGPNIWDDFTHNNPEAIAFCATGDDSCDHYNRIEEDVKLMSGLGIKAYRFSLSWSRILPKGVGKVNQKGIDFYNKLIDELIKNNITPFVTIYHWDLPSSLHKRGGWLSPESPYWFEEYSQIVAENFGDRVKNFITFNEAQVFTGCGYSQGKHAPGYKLKDKDLLTICHNVLLSHGRSVDVIRRFVPDAKIGFSTATTPLCPVNKESVQAAKEKYFESGKGNFIFAQSFWLDPIVFGKYPQAVLDAYKDEMPCFTEEDMKLISTPIDFIGVNTYTGIPVQLNSEGKLENAPRTPGFPRNAFNWDIVPSAIYWAPSFIYEKYKLPVYITENGMSCHDAVSLDGKVHDPNRIDFLTRYLRELRKACEDGIDIRGYFQWSLMDNFEWERGYEERFGLIYVDMATKERTYKDSAFWYKDVIKDNGKSL